ncbi:MAG: TIGR00730 family Rossman fold protein [Cephaloticoccus sp.]|nr:TIGR00730 family Rossman fold protein [Cephaloticoccus sp.]MCF7759990.1 TIGR00730 family Rossman fold protein [Cephaloticoccus sp.]
MRLLCVYCSSSRDLAPEYYAMAERVGREMVARGWGLVYGGGKAGLMGAVARGVKSVGGHVVGVIPEFMKVRELAYLDADELVTVETMAERKTAMIIRADGFLALPGGIGTLEEIAEVLTLRYLAQLDKPAVFYNQNGFYDDLLRFFERMQAERFRTSGMQGLYSVAATIEDIWANLDTPHSYEADTLWRAKN